MTDKNKEKSKTPVGTGGGSLRDALRAPALAVLTGLIIGAFAIIISGANVFTAYGALFVGSFGDPVRYFNGFQQLFSTARRTRWSTKREGKISRMNAFIFVPFVVKKQSIG